MALVDILSLTETQDLSFDLYESDEEEEYQRIEK